MSVQCRSRVGANGPAAKSAVPALCVAFDDKVIRKTVLGSLGKIDPEARTGITDRLIRELQKSDANLRQRAAEALGFIGPDGRAAVAALIGH